MEPFNGLGMHLGNLARFSTAKTRSVTAENPTGAKGRGGMATEGHGAVAARELGRGWKIAPSIPIPARATVVLADLDGAGAIQHVWLTTLPEYWRRLILRCHWDGEAAASVEVPLGDFFCNGWCVRCNVSSLPVVVNPAGGLNSYWEMPFRRHARVTIENLSPDEIPGGTAYQITYALTDVPEDRGYLHAQWRRNNPVPYGEVHTLLDGVRGRGHYVGTYLAWGVHNTGWWGEGEMKFYLDGDGEFPTIADNGTEDYFGGAWNFWENGVEREFNSPYLGLPLARNTDPQGARLFSLYRWHILDAIGFAEDIRVTVQALGWWPHRKYQPLTDDIASVACWYQTEPHAPFPAFPPLPERWGR